MEPPAAVASTAAGIGAGRPSALTRRGASVSKRAVGVAIAVAVAVCVTVLTAAIWRQVAAGPTIETQALGVWQEQTASQPLRVTVSAAPKQAGATGYWVSGANSGSTPSPARLDGDKIVVWGENTKDVVWIVTYDKGADALLITRPGTGERHVLRRVSH